MGQPRLLDVGGRIDAGYGLYLPVNLGFAQAHVVGEHLGVQIGEGDVGSDEPVELHEEQLLQLGRIGLLQNLPALGQHAAVLLPEHRAVLDQFENPQFQFVGTEGFYQIGIGPAVKPLQLVLVVALCGDDDHRYMVEQLGFANIPGHLQPVAFGHHDICNDDIG